MEDVAHINDVGVNPSASLALKLLHRSNGADPLLPSQHLVERSIGGMQGSQAFLRLFPQRIFRVSCNTREAVFSLHPAPQQIGYCRSLCHRV
jgi:hypothetical protein